MGPQLFIRKFLELKGFKEASMTYWARVNENGVTDDVNAEVMSLAKSNMNTIDAFVRTLGTYVFKFKSSKTSRVAASLQAEMIDIINKNFK